MSTSWYTSNSTAVPRPTTSMTGSKSETTPGTSTESTFSTKTYPINWDDATWVLTNSFLIFTMQSGFGLLESGSVSNKNQVNIMVKNAVDVVFGGLPYWIYGFGLSFGDGPYSNPFVGVGHFLTDADVDSMGYIFTWYIFQLSFATTSTTIVSGAMAERTKLVSYIVFSFFNTSIYVFPAHWIWGHKGFLKDLGVVDIAGCGPVHVVGAVAGLVATIMLKPRAGRFDEKQTLPPGNPTNCILGMFMLWWGWLGFNCGSTFGVTNGKWKLAARAAATTMNSSVGGGLIGILLSYIFKNRKFQVDAIVNSILGALVSITAICCACKPYEAIIIGMVGGTLTFLGPFLLERMRIDDPVAVIPVHGMCGIWGLMCVGIFVEEDVIHNLTWGRRGVAHGGGWYLLGVQTLSVVTIVCWSAVTSFTVLKLIDMTIGLRVSPEEEMLGADWCEHGLRCILRNKSMSEELPCDVAMNDLTPTSSRRASTCDFQNVSVVAATSHQNQDNNAEIFTFEEVEQKGQRSSIHLKRCINKDESLRINERMAYCNTAMATEREGKRPNSAFITHM